MIHSIETRWFLRTEPFPASDFIDDMIKPRSRVDWYAFPCDERSGVKIREGNFETKLRIHQLGIRKFGVVEGHVEEWMKWSVAFQGNDSPTDNILDSAGWIAVEKTRYLRVFGVNGNSVQEVFDWSNNWPEQGCQFEWTQLVVNGTNWWTVGLEAFGRLGQLENNLTVVGNSVFSTAGQINELNSSNSYSYPKWLQILQE